MGCTVTRKTQTIENSVKGSEVLEESGAEDRFIAVVRTIDEQVESGQGLNNAPQRPTDPTNDKFAWLISSSPH